jgi:hypothetical protein
MNTSLPMQCHFLADAPDPEPLLEPALPVPDPDADADADAPAPCAIFVAVLDDDPAPEADAVAVPDPAALPILAVRALATPAKSASERATDASPPRKASRASRASAALPALLPTNGANPPPAGDSPPVPDADPTFKGLDMPTRPARAAPPAIAPELLKFSNPAGIGSGPLFTKSDVFATLARNSWYSFRPMPWFFSHWESELLKMSRNFLIEKWGELAVLGNDGGSRVIGLASDQL